MAWPLSIAIPSARSAPSSSGDAGVKFLEAFRVAHREDVPDEWPEANPVTWREVLELLSINADELRAWVCFSAPYVCRGNFATGEGWQFNLGDLMRWSGLFFSHCKLHGMGRNGESLVEILEARGLW